MPPRVVKRGAVGPRRTARATEKQQPVLPEEAVKVEEVPVKEEEIPAVEDDNKPIAIQDEPKCDISGSVPATLKEEDVNEYVDEYEKDGRLDLDDNEDEYEPEEYGKVDNDDKEIEHEDVLEEGDEEDEHEEENVVDEEEVDLAEGEMEDFPEEHEGADAEEEVEHAGEEAEQPKMVYVEEDDHHQMFRERRKRKEFEVFVGGLDKDVVEDDLRKVFSQVGEVTEVRLMMNLQTKKNKGFAFLRFATVDQAKQAVTELKNPVINGKQCGVSPSQDSDTLFLGNICKTWTKEALKEKLKHYRVNNVEDLTLVEDSSNEGMNRGFAFLEFSSRSEAMDAFKRLQKREVLFGVDRPVKVSFADSFIDPGGEIMAQVKTVFIDGLSASWDEDRVHELLKKYGEITKIELARNMPSAKRKDFGFVTFDTHDAAIACAKSINNAELGEGDKKAKVRARLSRPLQRGKGKHASHGDFRSAHSAGQPTRDSRGHPQPRSLPGRSVRGIESRLPPTSVKRHVPVRDRRPTMSMPARARPMPLPPRPPRSYDRMVPVPSYPKSGLKREYGRRDEVLPPRSRAPVDYGSRVVSERRPYRDDYPSRGSGYSDMPKSTSRTAARRPYANDGYGHRFERPPPSYREGHARDYDSVCGSKRPYSAVDDAPPYYADASVRHPRARLDYDLGGGASQYGDAYGDRMGRFNLGYGGSRSSISSHDMHGLYKSRQGMGYGGGSYSGSDVGGMYSSSYDSDYMPHGSDVGGGSYSSIYSGRVVGGRSYMGSGGSRSYY